MIARSNATKWATASAVEAKVLAQRAIWFRLLLLRAIWRVRSRSTASAGEVHVRVRAIAYRSSADGDTPAASALSCQAACSAGVTRAAAVTVRQSAAVWIPKACRTMGYVYVHSLVVTPRDHPLRTG